MSVFSGCDGHLVALVHRVVFLADFLNHLVILLDNLSLRFLPPLWGHRHVLVARAEVLEDRAQESLGEERADCVHECCPGVELESRLALGVEQIEAEADVVEQGKEQVKAKSTGVQYHEVEVDKRLLLVFLEKAVNCSYRADEVHTRDYLEEASA